MPRRPRLTLFNHKGGVGKTTLSVNLASALAELGKRVLLVDSDPQGNLTSYLGEDGVVDDLLDHSDSADGQTIWSAVKPVVEGLGEAKPVRPIELSSGLFLLPGDIRLAEFESQLTTFWAECFQRRARGFRGVSALMTVVDSVAESVGADIVMYDAGPNIGALNKIILLDCDYFAVPAAADLFSLRAIKTLGQSLKDWIEEWRTIESLAPDDLVLLAGRPKPVGYIAQRFKVYGGEASTAYARIFPRLERAIQEELLAVLATVDPALVTAARPPLRIGEIKDFGTLANASQHDGVPLWRTESGTPAQRDDARSVFTQLAKTVLSRMSL